MNINEIANTVLLAGGSSAEEFAKYQGIIKGNHDARGLLTEKEACQWLKISKVHLYKMVKAGLIKRISLGEKTRRYLLADLQAFAAENREEVNNG